MSNHPLSRLFIKPEAVYLDSAIINTGHWEYDVVSLHGHGCYTPGIYADGYIVFAFPFVRSSVRMFVSSFVR